MNVKIPFGSTERTEIIDDNGSTRTAITNYKDGKPQMPTRLRYSIRHRTDKTDIETIAKIAKDLVDDFSKLDAELKIERSKSGELEGTFDLVECYTVLSYE